MRKSILVVIGLLLFVVLMSSSESAALDSGGEKATPGDYERKVNVSDLNRRYLVHVPKKYDETKPTPVVIVYHGGGGNPESMVRLSGMNKKSDEAGFIVVYPAGTGRFSRMLTFNGGDCCGYAETNEIDDVAFTKTVLDDLESWANVDKKRVFATGLSNGGIISYYMASELSDRIAAIAPVGGPMMTESCNPKRPVSVMHFHGTADAFAPFDGGKGKGVSGKNFKSVDYSLQNWIKANGCNPEPTTENLPNKVDDGTSVIRKTYGGGKEDTEVVLIEIKGGGHTWPGVKTRATFLGKVTMNISANDAMWEFFQKHPMK